MSPFPNQRPTQESISGLPLLNLHVPVPSSRQLEAIIRMSESLAKMQLQAFATEQHVEESLRLFQVSTLDAAMSGNLAGAEGFTTEEDQEELNLIEKQLKRRFVIGSQVRSRVVGRQVGLSCLSDVTTWEVGRRDIDNVVC